MSATCWRIDTALTVQRALDECASAMARHDKERSR